MSDRPTVLMARLRQHLIGWATRLTRGTGATRVEFHDPAGTGEFSVELFWNYDNKEYSYVHKFTRQYVFGASFQYGPLSMTQSKKTCDFVRDIMDVVVDKRKRQMNGEPWT